MKENSLLIKKMTFKYVFFLLILKNFFINSIKYGFFFRTKIVFQNSVSKIIFQNLVSKHIYFFFPENIKNCSKKLFSRIVLKNNNQTDPMSQENSIELSKFYQFSTKLMQKHASSITLIAILIEWDTTRPITLKFEIIITQPP